MPKKILSSLLETIKNTLTEIPNLQLAICFGSYANGGATSHSDIDIAVAMKHPLTMDERLNLAQRLSQKTNKEIDLIDLRAASGVLLQQIVSCRVTLINRNSELYGNLISRCLMEGLDYIPLWESILKARRERFIHG